MHFKTLTEAVAYWAEQTPDKICLIEAETGRSLSYGDFWRYIRVFAGRLQKAGLNKGDRVVVRVGPLLQTFVAQFGVYLAGGVYCPVEKHMKPLKIKEMLDYYDSRLLISSERVDFDGKCFELANTCENGEPWEDFAFPDPEDMAAVVFTTGTTGKAKGVMLSHKVNLWGAVDRQRFSGLAQEDVLMGAWPLDRVGGIKVIVTPIVVGGTVVHRTGIIFLQDLLEMVIRYKVTALHMQPPAIALLLDTGESLFPALAKQVRIIFSSNSHIPEKNKAALQARLPNTRIFIQYGCTEMMPMTFYEYGKYPGKPNCVGLPSAGAKIYMVSEEGTRLESTSMEHPGIVACEGAGIMLGYWKDPDLTAATIQGNRIIMTDIGYIGDDGFLYLLGRKDDVISSGGYKIAPYEIETVVMDMGTILECACVAVPNIVLGSIPVLFVVMKDGKEFSAKEVLDYLSNRIENFKLPRKILQIDEFPRVGGNKIDRKRLREYA